MNRLTKGIALSLAIAAFTPACGGNETGPLGEVDALVFLQRVKRNEMGDIFQYTSYIPGGRIVKLEPPSADGTLSTVCCDQFTEFAEADISSFDVSFDARQIVFSAKRNSSERYGLFLYNLDSNTFTQLPTEPNRDYVGPTFVPGDRIVFMSNAVVESGEPQFMDEYERGTTTQIGSIGVDGSDHKLGPRNLSHRLYPTMMSDGRVMFTQWDHLGDMNAGHLLMSNPDFTNVREIYGKEGTGISNSYLKAREISPGRVVAIATSRDRTIQAGALVDVRMGTPYTLDADDPTRGFGPRGLRKGDLLADLDASEANATYRILTPDVPLGREPSRSQVGRYYDAFPLNAKERPDILVSWADGPVESGTLGAAGLSADFGVYLYDTNRNTRLPIYNDPEMWDVFAQPLQPRNAPIDIADTIGEPIAGSGALLATVNVYNSTQGAQNLAPGEIYGVRFMEGFSSEVGIPMDFGTTEQEGHVQLGVAPLFGDGSVAAVVPANVPIQQQVVNQFGMPLVSETIWTTNPAGAGVTCNGCHEDRASNPQPPNPGSIQAVIAGPVDMNIARPRMATNYFGNPVDVRGVPWDLAVQPAFDAGCTSCHNGTPGPGNPTWELVDTNDPLAMPVQFTFDLRGGPVDIALGEFTSSDFSASYISMVGFSMEDLEMAGISITCVANCPPGGYSPPMEPYDYSRLGALLNPPRQFPTPDMGVRLNGNATNHGGVAWTAAQHYILILAASMGANWYALENNPNTY